MFGSKEYDSRVAITRSDKLVGSHLGKMTSRKRSLAASMFEL